MDKVVSAHLSREDIIEQVARLWAEGLTAQDARTPEEAAAAAGVSPDRAPGWIAMYRPDEAAEDEPTAA